MKKIRTINSSGPIEQRIRGSALQKLRRRFFQANPLCVECKKEGVITLAVELDHIVPLFKGGTNDYTNLQGMCQYHHKLKTAHDLGHKNKASIGLDGWPQ
jgi:5-methylcytosine-specific restriction protein A